MMAHLIVYLVAITLLSVCNGRVPVESRNYKHGLIPEGEISTKNQQPRSFPCPNEADIAPCVCSSSINNGNGFLSLDCSAVTSNEELKNVFTANFPVEKFDQFTISHSTELKSLDFDCGGVTFKSFYFYETASLTTVSDLFYASCASTELETIHFSHNKLSEVVFPPYPVSEALYAFDMTYSLQVTSIPKIYSNSLRTFEVVHSNVSNIIPGTFDDVPYLRNIYLYFNELTELKSGSIPITSTGYTYQLFDNKIESIEPGAFFLNEEPEIDQIGISLENNSLKTIDEAAFSSLMPYINWLEISGNPLDCNCDIAWIVLDASNLQKVARYGDPTCADGVSLTDLDPAVFQLYC